MQLQYCAGQLVPQGTEVLQEFSHVESVHVPSAAVVHCDCDPAMHVLHVVLVLVSSV